MGAGKALQPGPELVEAVTRLARLRRQLKELEHEEAVVRERVLALLDPWPPEAFPLAVGPLTVTRYSRPGRLDPEAARRVLTAAGQWQALPAEWTVADPALAEHLAAQLAILPMPESSRAVLSALWRGALARQPRLDAAVLDRLVAEGRLDARDRAACFKGGRPSVTVVAVR
ncbi:conserved protein of unknown function [Candidatus Hydrogenisulfobacillus filiaventi]|uniref:Uncharacterized protein n=1 Tax=Candidatus Hydrogenisulfobacillus filiaventi TaxID=2707344 RepID=A0A6F8ZEM6_9FIRM|nr:hypothetical protein [Bacillota bacterium]CAB1127912.1 conserved protein of unknown function [Candidatus Hydrogenisulfobacillus filiaventi]